MITIRKGTIAEIFQIIPNIPEFEVTYDESEYVKRLSVEVADTLLLVAEVDGVLAGFKVGYDRYHDGSFYSWMGGVDSRFRRLKTAKKLADYQENIARQRGYKSIRFRTRNRNKAMLLFALNNGFSLLEIEARDTLEAYRINLIKSLL